MQYIQKQPHLLQYFSIFRAQGTCLVAANVVLSVGGANSNSASQSP